MKVPLRYTIKGHIIGNGPGVIFVRTVAGQEITLDRFAAKSCHPDGSRTFWVPQNMAHKIKGARVDK